MGSETDGLLPYCRARIRRLVHHPDSYDGWGINRRAPMVGDIGTIIDILSIPDGPDRYVVECPGPDGVDIWLGDFLARELEPVEGSPDRHQ